MCSILCYIHSITVPRNYKIAANIVQKVTEEGGSFKTLLYDDKLKHFRIDVLYALINETIKHAVDIERLFESTGILVNEPRLNPWLAKVLTAELLYGKKTLPGESKPVQTILSYKDQFQKLIPEVQDDAKPKVRKPRYVRINTNLLTTSDAIRAFQDEGFKFIRCTSGSYNDYLQQIQRLTEDDFTQDYHVKTIFVFSPRIKMHDHEFYKESKIILQDKATALAVHLLAPPPGSVVLDMCAAPGMKTTQLAAYMRNEGKIYAVERDGKRYQTLCEFVETTGSTCVETLHKDSLQIRRGDMDDVEYILLDPSCSGSGMDLSVHNYVEESRMANLTSLQEKFLKHAMNSFPNAKRIVYSTCSIFPEENERVVTNIVKASRAKWRVKDVSELLKGQWNNFGSGMYGSMGTRCLYAKPDNDFTTGFFLAVLDRDFRDTDNQQDDNKVINDDDKMNRKVKDKINIHGNENVEECEIKDQEKQQNKKRHRDSESHNIEHVTNPKGLSECMDGENHVPKSKKKKRNKDNENSIHKEDSHSEKNVQYGNSPNSKKKKRKSNVKDEGVEPIIDTSVAANADENSKTAGNNDDSSHTQDISDDFKTETIKKKKKRKCLEEPESSETKTFEYNDEIEMPKKKKKKRKERERENGSITGPDIDISTVEDNKNATYEIEIPNKKNKKCKESLNNYQDAVNLPIDTSVAANADENSKTAGNNDGSSHTQDMLDGFKTETIKKKKKRKCLEEPECSEAKTFEYNDEIEMPKKKKKKRKERESENGSVTGPDIHISTGEDNKNTTDEIEIPNKKNKKCKESLNNYQDAVNLPVIDIFTHVGNSKSSENGKIFDNNDEIEMPKKKTKKRKNHENEPKEEESEIAIDISKEKENTSENINHSQIANIIEEERSKKKKKKRKERKNEPLEGVNISLDLEQAKTIKSKKKKSAAQ